MFHRHQIDERMTRSAQPEPQEQIDRVPSRLERVRREHVRWLCLVYLDHFRPAPTKDTALLAAVQADYPDATLLELRRSLDYLESHGLLAVKERGDRWLLKLTWQGIDLVEYTSPALLGIGRPA